MLFLSIFVTSIISALLQLASHLFVERWYPKLEFVPRYVIGALCMLIPPTVTILLAGEWQSALTYWCCVALSGVTVASIRSYEASQNQLRDDLDELERFRSREQNQKGTEEDAAAKEETG